MPDFEIIAEREGLAVTRAEMTRLKRPNGYRKSNRKYGNPDREPPGMKIVYERPLRVPEAPKVPSFLETLLETARQNRATT